MPKTCGKTWDSVPYAKSEHGLEVLPWGVMLECCGRITGHGKTCCEVILYHRFLYVQNITSHCFWETVSPHWLLYIPQDPQCIVNCLAVCHNVLTET